MKPIARIIGTCLPVLAVCMVVAQVIVSNELGAMGKTLWSLDQDISNERELSQDLEIKVASASSLMAIRERATAMGFIEPSAKQITHIALEVPVAFDPVTRGN